MSLSFRLIMIWSLTAASSAVQSIDVNFKLQCLASSNMGLQKAIKVSPSYCMFNRKWKGFSIIFSVGLKYAVVALTKSHQCVFFLVFSSSAVIHQSVYSLLDEYIPRNFETLSCDFICSQILSNCSNNSFRDAFSGAAVIFHCSIAASKDTFGRSGYVLYCS